MKARSRVIASCWIVVAGIGCGGATEDPPRGDSSAGNEAPKESAAEDVAGVEKDWETGCTWSTCKEGKRFVECTDPNEATHYHFDGRSCMCESPNRQCGECDRLGPCSCAIDVKEWCRTP